MRCATAASPFGSDSSASGYFPRTTAFLLIGGPAGAATVSGSARATAFDGSPLTRNSPDVPRFAPAATTVVVEPAGTPSGNTLATYGSVPE